MTLGQLFVLSKKIHKLLLLVIVTLGLIMMITGTMLKYTFIHTKLFSFIDLGYVRYLHNNLSTFFSLALGLMMLTGLGMYFLPTLMRKNATKKNDQLHSH